MVSDRLITNQMKEVQQTTPPSPIKFQAANTISSTDPSINNITSSPATITVLNVSPTETILGPAVLPPASPIPTAGSNSTQETTKEVRQD